MNRFLMPSFYCILGMLILLSESRAYSLGLGIVLGGPTGVSLKSNPGGRTAIDGAFALSGNKLTLQAHYIKHHSRLVYYGFGARMKMDMEQEQKDYTNHSSLAAKGVKKGDGDGDDLGLGDIYGRAPVGVRMFIEQIEVFGEGALLMKFVPSTSFSIEIALGARVYF